MARFETDSVAYLRHAADLLGPPDAFHGPGYPLAIAALSALGLHPFAAALVVSAAAALALVALGASLSDRPGEGLGIGALLVLSPAVLAAGELALSDALGAALAWGALHCLLRGHPDPRRLVLGGVLVGAAILVRSVYLGLLALPLLTPGGRARAAGIVLPVALLVLAPWMALSAWHTGDPWWNHHHLNAAFHLQGGRRDWTRFPTLEAYPTWASVIAPDPGRFFSTWARSWLGWPLRAVDPVLAGAGWLLPLGVIAFVREREGLAGRAALALGLYALPASLVWMEPRFALPAAPLLAWGVVRGAGVAGAWVGRALPAAAPLVRRGLLVACALLMAARAGREIERLRQDEAPEAMQLARELAVVLPPGARVLAPKPHAAHAAGMEPVPFSALAPSGPLHGLPPEALVPRLRAQGIEALVFDARVGARDWPALAPLLSGPPPPGLVQIAHVAAPQRILAFRVEPGPPDPARPEGGKAGSSPLRPGP